MGKSEDYTSLLFIVLITLLINTYREFKNNGLWHAAPFLLLQFSGLAFILYSGISYEFFLFMILCGLIAVIWYCLLQKTLLERLLSLGAFLVIYFVFSNYVIQQVIPVNTYHMDDLIEINSEIVEIIQHIKTNQSEQDIDDISYLDATGRYIELRLEEYTNHIIRLLDREQYINEKDQAVITHLSKTRENLVSDFAGYLLEKDYEAKSLLDFFKDMEVDQCMEVTHLRLCHHVDELQVHMDHRSRVAKNTLLSDEIFHNHLLIVGEEQSYYFHWEESFSHSYDQLTTEYNGKILTVHGRIR